MKRLVNLSKDAITLGQLRNFLNNSCGTLPDNTPIRINDGGDDDAYNCRCILADEQNVTLYCN